jgi:hypothetical protein
MRAPLGALIVVLLTSAWFSTSVRAERAETYARIVSERAPLYSGPGAGFRVLHEAKRDESYRVLERGPVGDWLELEQRDGSHVFVRGADVWLLDEHESTSLHGQRSALFAPPPLLTARGELSVSLGALSGSGFLAVRPSYMLSPVFALEASFGASVGAPGRLFLLGLGGVVNVFPSWPITPFFVVGGGGMRAAPNSDAFAFEEGTRSLAYGGGGLRFGFRHRLIVRVEGRGYAMFDPNRLTSQQEISGGLSAFF